MWDRAGIGGYSVKKKRISKQKLVASIQENSTELSIQKLIEEDLSLLSEVYAYPLTEYICFSEFPIGDGFADFVIFTGRSRMEVIIVEIKGAYFNFSNNDSYNNLSSKINEAHQQIRGRFSYINKHYEEFRSFVHRVRKRVEGGKDIYNSLMGPSGYLEVDPNKDICVSGVIVGGRCRDDIHESKLRHEYEALLSSRIRVESWDSWLRKLTRD